MSFKRKKRTLSKETLAYKTIASQNRKLKVKINLLDKFKREIATLGEKLNETNTHSFDLSSQIFDYEEKFL